MGWIRLRRSCPKNLIEKINAALKKGIFEVPK